MKLSRKFHAVAKGHLGLQWKAKFLSCAALLSLVGLSQQAWGQGSYYPVFPVGAPYGSTYTGTPVLLVNELNFVESILQGNLGPNVTLQIPIPTGKVAPTTAELAAAVLQASQAVLGNTAPPGITLQSLSREVVAYKPADRVFTVDAITGAVVADGSLSVAGKVTKLNDVAVALAQAQPALIDSLIQPILAQARTDASVAQQGIPLLTVSAISAIPRDSVRVGAIIGTAVSNIGQSTVLTSGQKTTLYTDPTTGLIKAVLSGSAVDNNPALIDAALKKFTETNSLNFATLNQVLDSAVLGLSTKNNYTVGALAAGALRSQGGSAALIQTRLNLDLAGTPLLAAQANEFVDGYLQGGSLGTLSTELAGNSRADAVAGGAAIRAALSTAIIVKQSLVSEQATGGGSLTSAKDVVKAVVAANLDQVVSTVVGSIQGAGDPVPFTPWGDGTLADVAGGAIAAARIESVGAVTQNVIQKSASSVSSLNSATVNSIVNASIFDASASGKSGAFADIVYKAEYVARSTVGASGPLVRQAIQSVNTVSAGAINTRPHYIVVVAALAGAANAQRNEIRDAAFLPVTGELYTLAGGPGNVLAATYGANLVRDILGNTARAYTTTLTAFNSANAGTNPGAVPSGPVASNVLAGVYAAVLVNTNESSAGLAAAIKQSDVPAATLTSAAIDAVRGVNATKEPSLKLVGEVAAYAKASALAGTSDPLDYVGRQIIGNPTLVKDIATAWTVVDPNHAHYVSHAVAFNSPASITTSISAIFTYAQITNPTPFAQPTVGNPTGALGSKTYLSGNKGVIIDQPAAAAAITAGLVTGILEAKLTAADEKSKLVSAVSAAVVASIAQDNTYLRGPTNPFNFAGDSSGSSFTDQGGSPATVGANPPSPVPAANAAADNTEGFRQSNGLGGLKTGLGARTVGAAGAITGYIAQTTKAGDTSIVKAGETASTAGSVAFAVLQAASAGQARQYGLEIAQAAAQALRWVAGSSVNAAQAAADIANAIAPSVVGVHDFSGLTLAQTFAKLQTAALFGISEAANGTIGAGALGLNATGLSSGSITVKAAGNNNADFYVHRSATGTPVTDIFNL